MDDIDWFQYHSQKILYILMETFLKNTLVGVRQWINTRFDEVTLAEPAPNEIVKMLWDGDIKMSDLKQTSGSTDITPIDSKTNKEHFLDIFYPNPEEIFVDLGLSVKWAAVNLGAHNITDYGNFYAWGETETKDNYSWDNYKHANGAYNKLIKYCPTHKTNYWDGIGQPDNKLFLDIEDDLFKRKYYEDWENKYRMPTKKEIQELLNLPNKWVTNFKGISGLNGRIFAKTQVELDGTFNDDTMLFIPAAGNFNGSAHSGAGSDCNLWSSSLTSDNPGRAWSIYFSSGNISMLDYSRYLGRSVRCVSTD